MGLSRITFPWKRKRARKSIVGVNYRDLHDFFLAEFILHEIFSVNGAVDKPVYVTIDHNGDKLHGKLHIKTSNMQCMTKWDFSPRTNQSEISV